MPRRVALRIYKFSRLGEGSWKLDVFPCHPLCFFLIKSRKNNEVLFLTFKWNTWIYLKNQQPDQISFRQLLGWPDYLQFKTTKNEYNLIKNRK